MLPGTPTGPGSDAHNLFARNGRWTSNLGKIATLKCPRQPFSHEMDVGRQKLRKNCDFEASRATLSHENGPQFSTSNVHFRFKVAIFFSF